MSGVKRESKKTMGKKREKRMRRRCRRSVCGDDFTDVSDDHSLLTPRPPPPVPEPQTSDCPVNDYLLKRGFGFKRDKLADCLRQLEDSELDVPEKAEFCIQKFLISDLNSWGCGILPSDLGLQTFLHGPYVLQVDEIINPSNPPERWYEESPEWVQKRFLKLSMTDGIQRLYGIEFEPIDDLKVSASPGFKVSISNVNVNCGKLILKPTNFKILRESIVEQLDESQGDELNTMRRKREKRMRLLRRSASSAAVDQPQLQICGDDFTDVSDDHSLPTPPPPPPVPETQTSDCPVNDFLLKRGFGINRDTLADCLRQLGDSGFDVLQKAAFCIQKFLFSDLNSWGGGILPSDLSLQTFLHGPYVLQVDKISNVSLPPQSSRYEEYPPGIQSRFLMLSMTDGIQRVDGIELERIYELYFSYPPGLKVSISNVEVFRGKLILGPENITTLGGGLVEQLDESQLNKPSKEKSNGVLPLHAARPSSRVDDPSHSHSMLHGTDTVQASNQGDELNTIRRKREKRMHRHRRSAFAAVDQPQLQICGDDFTDVSDDHSLPTPPPPPPVNHVGAVSLADAPAFKKAPGGAPANVAGGFSESRGSSASRSKAKIFRYGSISLIDEPFKYSEFAALKVAEDPDGILKDEAVKNHITYIWELANVIKISKDEITFWTGGDVSYMLIHPNIKLLIVTEGSEGFIYHTKDFKGSFSGVDTTGAGDAFNYRILYSMASDPSIIKNQKRLREVFKKVFANACGASR